MKEIQLTQGKVALVDDADFDWLNQWKWTAHQPQKGHSFYAIRTSYAGGRKIAVRMHRLILGLADPKVLCDHRDGDGLNNQRDNLRKCDHKENGRNRLPNKSGTSPYKGVSFKAQHKKWVAQIGVNNKQVCVGYFDTDKLAAIAYNKAAIKHFGEFARLNVITD